MYDYKDKKGNISKLNNYMLLKTLSMFHYNNVPESLNMLFIEKQLQSKGFVYITEVDGTLYAFDGSLGGTLDVYGEPTTINISNSAINFNKTLNIKEDGVLIKNNDLQLSLLEIIDRHNTLLIENEITMFIATYNSRIQTLISAGDDKTKLDAERYLEKVVAGDLGVIGENRIFDGINAHSTKADSAADITKIVEFNQYIKASLYNELGLNANFNMKRERLNESEVEMNTDSLYPMVDNMFLNRYMGFALVNEKYGTEIEVDFGSTWKTDDGLVKEDMEEKEPSNLEQIVHELEEKTGITSNSQTSGNMEQVEPEENGIDRDETTEQLEPDTEQLEPDMEQDEPTPDEKEQLEPEPEPEEKEKGDDEREVS